MKRGDVSVCLRDGKAPPCKHWEPDYVGFKCHGYNKLIQKCTGYEPGEPDQYSDHQSADNLREEK